MTREALEAERADAERALESAGLKGTVTLPPLRCQFPKFKKMKRTAREEGVGKGRAEA